jgi:hypothetical protein
MSFFTKVKVDIKILIKMQSSLIINGNIKIM